MQLNPAQARAVAYLDGPLLVLAGAGSGKTRVIIRKIRHLLREGWAPETIFAVTFTNRAAREMRERLLDEAGEAAQAVAISTFHRLGLRILRENPRGCGRRSGFSILNGGDVESLLRALLRQQLGEAAEPSLLKEEARLAASLISRWKNEDLTPQAALAQARSSGERASAALYEAYEARLAASNAVDFDDLIVLPARLLRGDPSWRATWQARVRYLLVDEYQDTNGAQYQLLRALVGSAGALTVVGDDDQSIYAWRGARPENLRDLAADFPALEVVKLEENYRSRQTILRAANALIAHNEHLFEKRLWSQRGAGDPLRVVSVEDEDVEAERIAAEIAADRVARKGAWGDYAVIYRSNHQVRRLELCLQALRIPYRISGGGSFFDKTEVRDALAYFRLVLNLADDMAFLRIVNVPRRQLGAGALAALTRVAAGTASALLPSVHEHQAEPLGKAYPRFARFKALIHEARDALRRDPPAAVLRSLLETIDYEGYLRSQEKHDRSRALARWQNVELLLSAMDRRTGEGDAPEDVLRSLMLDDGSDTELSDSEVQLLTLHAAKGLEFAHVWLMGMEEGL
ncbi:MAG: UvrD-helicase domain-containing protein, partial [Pseudomonadota bacterium]|nr:UvrD-helicase domain-containing protein [Pseudomonadota bacterium]